MRGLRGREARLWLTGRPRLRGAFEQKPACDANGGIANPCGGFEPLRYENVSAAPGVACGACSSGLLACLAPNELGCIGETADACSDAGAGGASGQAGAESSGSGGPFAGSGGTSGNDIGNRDDYGCTRDANTYNGKAAKPGDACGPCGDGHLGCSSVSTKLACAGATIADYCAAVADAPNSCGGKGPTTWRGVSNTVGFRCGACGNGGLACATKNTLTCVTSSSTFSGVPSCNHASPQNACTIAPSDYSAKPPHTPPAPPSETKPTVSSYASVGVTVSSLVFNPYDQRLYGSVPSAAANGNAVVVVNPATSAVVKYIPTGSEPKSLALSDDGQVLWVINSGSNSLRRIDVASQTAGAEYPLSAASAAQRLAVLPGTQDSVLLATSSAVTIYDAGVPRPDSAYASTTPVVATNSPSLAYAYDSGDTGFGFATFCLNENGVFTQRVEPNILSGFNSTLLFDGGVVYGIGSAYDIVKQQVIGTYSSGSALALDPAARRLFWLSGLGLVAYDMDAFASAGSDPFFKSVSGSTLLVRWGRYGVAFTYGSDYYGPGTLYVGKSVLVP